MKKILSVKMLFLLMGVALLVSWGRPQSASAKSDGKYVVDMADILSSTEEAQLEQTLKEMSERLKFDVVVVTTSNLDGKKPVEYADDYFDYNGYGQGDDRSGCLFLRYINGSQKEVWISTRGQGLDCIYDNYIDHIYDMMTDDVVSGRYFNAFSTYAKMVDETVTAYHRTGSGIVIDYNSGKTEYVRDDDEEGSPFWAVVIALGLGLISALIYTGSLKSQLKSVHIASEAKAYEQSFILDSQKDRFVRSAVTKVAIESSSSGGSHSSSSHHSSSGASHGGGGRHM